MPLYLKEETKPKKFNSKKIFLVILSLVILFIALYLIKDLLLIIHKDTLVKIGLLLIVLIICAGIILIIKHYLNKISLQKRKIQTLEEEIRRLRQSSN